MPPSVDEAAALFRSVLSGKRVLVVLDNARDTAQVRVLLPGSPQCRVVVTSRDHLPGLVTRDGAHRTEVPRFSDDQAQELFTRVLGAETADAAALTELARRCAHLPLALRVAAERLLWRPDSLSELLQELDEGLDPLDDTDPDSAVRAVFSWSYRLLPVPAARLFRLLGAWPGPDVDLPTAAGLLGAGPRDARKAVDVLARAHLIEEPAPGRVTMHDLLRAYATELAEPAEVTAALRTALDRHLAIATTCMNEVDPHRRRVPPPKTVTAQEESPEALAWLDAEHRNLLALTRYAAAHGLAEHAWYAPHTLARFYLRRRHIEDWIDMGRTVLAVVADPFAEAETRTHLATAHANRGDLDEAEHHYRRALLLHRGSEAVILGNLGTVLHRKGAFDDAVEHYRKAISLLAADGDHRNESLLVANLAGVLNLLHRHGEALVSGARALDLARSAGDTCAQAHALRILGIAHCELGAHEEAARHLGEALALAKGQQDETDEGQILTEIAHLRTRQGRHDEAVDLHRRAVDIARRSGDVNTTAVALLDLGQALITTGAPAAGQLREALDLATSTGDRHHAERARALLAAQSGPTDPSLGVG
ncbi:tetratricopeptide repeat protein [Lentzea sp. E54]|uniref:tetratricopeptide repeat protein n=1 Tax=Lentzea xerophila TaxID=3435883 RepID=UPI003DA31107